MWIQVSAGTLWTGRYIRSGTTAVAWQLLLLTGSATAMELMLLAQTLPMILCDVFHKEYSYHEYTIAGIPGNSL